MKLPISRMVLGLALKGDHWPDETGNRAIVFVDTFRRKKDADTLAASLPSAKSHGYLYGRFDRPRGSDTTKSRASPARHSSTTSPLMKPPAILYPPSSQCILRTLRFLAREFLRDLGNVLRCL